MSIDIHMHCGVITGVEMPDGAGNYLVRDFDLPTEWQTFLYLSEDQYPNLVIDVKGGRIVNIVNNTGLEHAVFDENL